MARQRKKSEHSPPTFHLETLERRILFSADAAWTALDVMPEPAAELVMQFSHKDEAANDDSIQAGVVRAKELVVLDSALEDLQTLLDDLNQTGGDDLQVVVLDAHTDALSQISNILAKQQGLTAVHVMSHGGSGALELGGQQIETLDLLSRADDVAQWRSALAPDADFFLYGCEVAADETGRQLVDTLARLTGADVSASTDLTEFAGRAGEWQLEYHQGDVQSDGVPSAESQGKYDETLVVNTSDSLIGVAGLAQKEALTLLSTGDDTVKAQDAALEYSQPYEVVFLDTGVENYQLLLNDLLKDTQTRNVEVVLLDNARDGISIITDTLLQKKDIDAVHILSHGSDQAVQLGATRLSQSNLEIYASQISQWQSSLSEDADLLLYGCDLAANASGQFLLESLSALTLADVAASVDLTGSASEGGDWDLEYSTGQIDIDVAVSVQVQHDWSGLLDITSDLVLHLALEESSGSVAQDSTANDNDGTWFNGPTFTTDSVVGDRSYDFGLDGIGSNAVVSVADDASLDFSSDFTVSFWYNADVAQDNSTRLVGSHDGTSGFSIFADADGSLNLFLDSTGGSTSTLSRPGGLIADGNWHHVTVTRVGTSFTIYVDESDGGVTNNITVAGTINPSAPLTIGGESPTVGDYEGKIDDVRVYMRGLSASDVSDLYDLGDNGQPAGYPYSYGNNNSFEWITNVTYAGIDNDTGMETGGYGNYTSPQIATITRGDSNDLTIGYNYDENDFGEPEHIKAWIDWNQDGDFLDVNEEVYTYITPAMDGSHTISVSTPADATVGNTVLRVALDWRQDPTSDGMQSFGEVEDYAVTIGSGPQTFTVTNTLDDGSSGSLRWAINQANANVGADTIDFNIPGNGTQVIGLGSALPGITEQVSIDGTTQTDWVEQLYMPVVIDGNDIGRGIDLGVGSDGSEIRGLVLRDFSSEAIFVDSENNLIAGNWLGQFNSDGSDAGIGEAITNEGILSWDNGSNNVVGGITAGDRNVIVTEGTGSIGAFVYNADNWTLSGNYFGTDTTGSALLASTTNPGFGIETTNGSTGTMVGGATDAHRNVFAGLRTGVAFEDFTVSANYIYNNWFGLGADGTTVLGNNVSGVSLFDSHNTVIGGSGGLGNVFVGSSSWYAIDVANSAQGTVIQGNYIGQNESGSVVSGNSGGIYVDNVLGTMDVTIGGIAAGEGNVIRGSAGDGITVYDVDSSVSIRGNRIFDNDGSGIDLNGDGVTLNDVGDIDTGPSGLQNWAVLNSASIADDGTFTYNLDTTTLASGIYTIDLYASTDRDGGHVEGERYIGTITGVPAGNSALIGTLSGITMTTGEFVTLVTTDASGNSSEFSTYAVALDGDSDGISPQDIKATATANGGLSINADGGNDIYLIADDSGALLGGLSALSFETQFSAPSASGYLTLLSYAVAVNNNEVVLEIQDNGSATLHIAGAAVNSTAMDYTALWDGSTHSMGFTWDSSTGNWAIFADGVLVDSTAISGGTLLSNGQTIEGGGVLLLGQEQDTVEGGFSNVQEFSGTLFNARLFGDVRTAAEMSATYRGELPFDEAGMLAQWTFDALSVDGVVTDTVSGNNLTIKHTSEIGFTPSEATLTFLVDENSLDGSVVGSVSGVDPQREARISALLASDADLRYSAETGKFYKLLSSTDVNYTTALSDASTATLEGIGGQLVTIRSAAEQQIVMDIAPTATEIWLGATDATVEGEWRWLEGGVESDQFWFGLNNGYKLGYENWGATQPNDGSGTNNYAVLDVSNGSWADRTSAGGELNAVLVEWNADDVLDVNQALTYVITAQTVIGAFDIDADTGEIHVLDVTLLDAETQANHTITVEITDVNLNTYNEDFTISLNDLVEDNNAPTDLSSGIELNTDGGNDAYLFADDGGAILGGASELTLEIAFATESSAQAVLTSYVGGAGRNDLNLFLQTDGTLSIIVDNAAVTGISGIDYNTLRDGDMHRIALSWDNTNGDWVIHVDGIATDSGTGLSVGGTLNGSSGVGGLVFGQEQESVLGGFQTGEVFSGTLYEVRIWNQVRSAAEINLNHQHKFDSGSLPSGLIANWQMDGFNGSGEVVDLVSGNNLNIGHVAAVPLDEYTNIVGGASTYGSTIVLDSSAAPSSYSSQVNSEYFSSLGYTDDYTVSFTLDEVTPYNFMIGLGLVDGGAHFSDIDHAMYFTSAGNVFTYQSGTGGPGAVGSPSAGDEFSFYVNGTTLQYKHNGATFHTETITANSDWYLDTSFTNEADVSLSNVRIFDGATENTSFIYSDTPVDDLHISEHAADGATVGFVVPSDPDAPQDIVSDGQFLNGDTGAWQDYLQGQSFGDWTVESGAVSHTSQYISANGGVGLELQRTDGDLPSAITQTLTTEVGRQYQVVFGMTGNFSGGDAIKYLTASAGGVSMDFQVEQTALFGVVYEGRSLTFTADSTSTILRFASGADDGFAAVISDVQVIELPEAISTILSTDPTLDYDAATDKFYRFVNSADDFDTQLAAAISANLNGLNGQLVTIRSDYENQLIRQYSLNSGNNIWLGAGDTNNDGNWNWRNGNTESDDQFWVGGSAGNAAHSFFAPTFGQSESAGEDYVRLNSDGSWADDDAGSSHAYVIEWNASDVLSNFTFDISAQDSNGPLFAANSNTGEIRLAKPSTPDSYNDHVAWLDATDASTVTVVGDTVTNIADKTGTGNDAKTSGAGAELISGAINGLDALQFDGAGERLFLSDAGTINEGIFSAKTLSLVLQTSSDIANRQVLFEQGSPNAGLNIYIDGGNIYAGVFAEGNGFDGEWHSTAIDQNTTYVVTIVFDVNANEIGFYANGALIGSSDMPVELNYSTGNIGIGYSRESTKYHDGAYNSTGHYYNGMIGELTYNNEGLVGNQIVDLHAYLMNKWMGVTTTLDYETAISHDVGVQVMDAAGNGYTETLTIMVDKGIEPTQVVPGVQTVDEGEVLTFSNGSSNAITVSDSVSAINTLLQVFISVDNGILNLSQTTGLSFSGGADGTDFMTLQGTETDINAAFEGMTFTPDTDFNGSVILDIATSFADLEARYTFEGGSAVDQSAGTGENGSFVGNATTWIDSDRGEVLSLDGNGDYVQVSSVFGEPQSITLSTWVNVTGIDSGGGTYIEIGSGVGIWTANFGAYNMGLQAFAYDGSTFQGTGTTENIIGTGWRHLAMTHEAATNTLSLYLDSELVGTLTTTGSLDYGVSSTTTIGSHGVLNRDVTGLMDDVRVYNRALSDQEIAALAAEQSNSSDSLAITVAAVNDAPRLIKPELVSNGEFPTNLSDWATAGTVDQSGGSLRFGDGNAVGPHSASQTINTISGATYELSFDYRDGRNDRNQSMQVTVDGASNLLTTPQIITDIAGSSYVRYTYSFTADSTNATVTFTDTSDTAGVSNDTNTVDGHLDNVSVRYQSGTMSEVAFVENGTAVVLDADVEISDAELSASDNFSGATLTIVRNGGANSEDMLSFNDGNGITLSSGHLSKNSQIIATFDTTSTAGELLISFTDANGETPTNNDVNVIMQQIAYANSSDIPDASVDLNWTFNDGNLASVQGGEGAKSVTGSTTIDIQNSADLQIIAPANNSTNEDTPIVFTGGNVIQVYDGIFTDDSPMRVSLSVANGILTLADQTGITFVESADNTPTMVIEGLESDLNNALDGLEFIPNRDHNGGDMLSITTALASDMLGNYTFETDTSDRSAGTSYDGTLNGNATIVTDAERGPVLSLDGDDDFVQIDGLLSEPANVTLSSWVNLDSLDTSGAVVISMGTSPALYFHTDGTLVGFYESGGSSNTVQSTDSLLGTGWRHVAVSIDAANSSMTLYIDGVAVSTTSTLGVIEYDNSPHTYIGRAGNGLGGFDFDGTVDDARIYARALSADEVAALATDQVDISRNVAITVNAINDAPSFATPGEAIFTDGEWGYGQNEDSFVLSDGSMIITPYDNIGDSTVVKLNADGTIDTAFGASGNADNALIGYIQSIAEQPDGKILVAGNSAGDIFIARYNADGTVDTSFNLTGINTLSTGTFDEGHDIAVQSDGSIVLVGESGDDALITRFTSSGAQDSGFGSGGITAVDLGETIENLEAVAVLPDGSIVAVGETHVVKLDSVGIPDAGFGVAGILNLGNNTYDVTVQSDGKFVVVGGDGTSLWATRFNADGVIDAEFGAGGTANWSSVAATGYSVVQQSDGKLVVVGVTDAYPTQWVAIRFTVDGLLDTSFGDNGAWVQATSTDFSQAYSVSLYHDGTSEKIVIGGYTTREGFGNSTYSTMVRLTHSGEMDVVLGTNTLDGNPTFVENGSAVVLDTDASIFDAELSSNNDFGGATLTLERNGVANSDDVFSASGNLNLVGTTTGAIDLTPAGVIGTYSNTGGTLALTFAAGTTNDQINEVMRSIAYGNMNHSPPASIQLDWTFDDGNNASAQGSEGAKRITGSTIVDITPVDGGISVSVNDPSAFGLQVQASQSATSGDATYLSQAVALSNDGSYVVAWASASDSDGQGVYSQRYDADGNPLGAETHVNTTVTGSQNYASVAMDSEGNYVVVWQGEGSGDTDGVFGQRYNASGIAQGGEFLVNTTTTGSQAWSSIAMSANGEFVIVWHGEGLGDTSGVFAQRYDANGIAQGSELLVNSTLASSQRFGEVSMDNTGNFTVTWTSSGQDADGDGVYVRQFRADGTPITTEIQVDADTAGGQWLSQLDVNASGEFVVVWRDDGATDSIQAQRFNADGSKNGSEIIVSDLADVGDNYPTVQLSNNGSFVVVWQSINDSGSYGIYARQFDASGTAMGGSLLINSRSTGGQENPAVSMNDSGQFVIAFEDLTTATVESRVYGLVTTEAGGTASADVVLDVAPTADVTIAVSMPDLTEGSLSTNLLTFTDSNWNTPQTVTITGLSDSLNDGDIRHLLVLEPASSTDLNYDGLNGSDIVINNFDRNPLVDLDEDDSVGTGDDFSVTYVENTAPVVIVDTDAVINNPDTSNLDSLVVTITNLLDGTDEVLAADTSGTSITAGYTGGVLTLSGTDTVAHYQQVLRTVTYENAATEPDQTNRSISFVLSDGTSASEAATSTVSIANAADLSIIAPATASTDEGTSLVYSGANVVSVDDGVAADTPIQVSLAVTNGLLTLADQSGITFVEGADGNASMVIEGLESNMNTALNGLIFTPNGNYNGADTLNITTAIAAGMVGHYTFDDTTANDSSAGSAQHGVFNGDAATTNDAERGDVLHLDGIDDSVQVSGTYSDSANVTLAAWVNLASADANGAEVISLGDNVVLRVDDSILGGLVGFYYDGSSWVEITANGVTVAGTGWNHIAYVLDDANDSHALYLNGVEIASSVTSGSVSYTNGTDTFIGSHGNGDAFYDFNGLIGDARVYSRALTADEIAALATGPTEVSDSVAISVYALNDAPVLDNTGVMMFTPVTEDDVNNAGQTVASVIASAGGDRITDVEADPEGIAITAHNNSALNGPFEFSLDGGSSWTRMGFYDSSESLLLRATDLIRFVPQGAVTESASLEFRAWDQTSGTAGSTVDTSSNGESTPFSSSIETATMTTTGLNDAPQFGSPDAGVSIYTTTVNDNKPSDIVILSDGSQVVVGTESNDIVLTKFYIDGTVDTTFGDEGRARSGFMGDNDSGYSIDVDAIGRLVVAGRVHNGTDYDATVMRFNADGTLDDGFAVSGAYIYSSAGSDRFDAIIVQSDGKIIAAGQNNTDALVVRLNTDGSLDNAFDTDGIVTFDLESGGTSEQIDAIGLQSDGKVIVAGERQGPTYREGFVTRLSTTGSLDTSFGGTGTVSTTFALTGDIKEITDVLVQADGKIVIAGAEHNWWHWGLTRFNANGTLDTSFNSTGHIVESFGGNWGSIGGIEQQSDGKLVVAGYISFLHKGQSDWVITRYNLDGSVDSTYGDSGVTLPQVGYYWNELYTTGIAVDDSIVVAGYTSHTTSTTVGYFDTNGLLNSSKQNGLLDGNPTYIEDETPVVLDADVYVFDRDLSNTNYNGTTLTLIRNGGANADDIYSGSGSLSALIEGGNLVVDGTTIGSVATNSGGTLELIFNTSADQERINEAVSQIAYSNNNNTPPASVQIDWTFDDGNDGVVQGSGGALQAIGATIVDITSSNNAPFGVPVITGIVTEDETLTADPSGISDADGVGTFSYQWQRDGVDIAGATGATYTTTQADVGSAIGVVASYTDGQGTAESVSSAATAIVTNVNDAPSLLAISNSTVAENTDTGGGFSVGLLSTVDVDANDTFTYSVVGGADASVFTIGGAGLDELMLSDGLLNFESQSNYAVTIRTSDAGGLTHDQSLVISVSDVNEAPVMDTEGDTGGGSNGGNGDASVSLSVNENQTDVVRVSAEDEDLDATLIYSVSGGADQSAFTINTNTGVLNFVSPPDFETKDRFEVEVSVTDNGGLSAVQSLQINVQNVNESPTAQTDTLEGRENQRLIIDPVSSLLSNDADPEQDALRLVDFTQPQNGTLTLNAQGMLVYEPAAEFVGWDGFDYVVEDAGGLRVSARVWLNVMALSDPIAAAAQPTETGVVEIDTLMPEQPVTTHASEPSDVFSAIAQASSVRVALGSGEFVAVGEDTSQSTVAIQDPFAAPSSAELNTQAPASAAQPPPTRGIAPSISSLLEQLLEYDLAELDASFDLLAFEQSYSIELRDAILTLRNQIDQMLDQTPSSSIVSTVAPSVVGASLTAGIVTWVLRSGLLISITVTTAPLWRPLDPVPILVPSDDDEPWYEKGKPVDSIDPTSAANEPDNQDLKHG